MSAGMTGPGTARGATTGSGTGTGSGAGARPNDGLALLGGRYRLLERLAAGGMGEVWRAVDTALDRPVAVKTLRPEHVGVEELHDLLRAEAKHAAGLSHPGIASVFDVGDDGADGGGVWIVMELVEGRPLSELLAGGPLPLARALDVVGQAGLALQAAHDAGVVHRDIKPGNLLVRADGVVKVTDFGIAHALGSSGELAEPGGRTVVGTAYYLSPEQAAGRAVSPASDVYSLGVVAHECLAGTRPFPGNDAAVIAAAHLYEPPPPLPAEVPEGVRDLIASALAKSPADRPADAGTFGRAALALAAQAAAEPGDPAAGPATGATVTDPPVVSGPAARRAGRHRGLVLAGVLLAVVLTALVARAVLGPVPDGVEVPDVAGSTVAQARQELEDARLAVAPLQAGASSTVVRTDPPAGEVVPAGEQVVLVVSSRPGPRRAGTVGSGRSDQGAS